MKLDGLNMEPSEAVAEPSLTQGNIPDQAQLQSEEAANDATPGITSKGNGRLVAADTKIKQKAVANKPQPTAKSARAPGSSVWPATASHRNARDVKTSSTVSAAVVKKMTTTKSAAAAAAGAVPKRPMGVAAVSSIVKNQIGVPDKKPVGQSRATFVSGATVTNGTKSIVNGTKKRLAAETVSVERPKHTAITSRPAVSTGQKSSTPTTTKAVASAVSKTTRPATGSSTSQPTPRASRPSTATTKPSTTSTAKTTVCGVIKPSSTGRITVTQPPKNVAAKKDVSRPPSAAKKTTTSATRKPEPSKPTVIVKNSSASKSSTTTTTTADPKLSQTKTQPPIKSISTKKPVAAARFPTINKPPLGRTPPASPANRPSNSNTSQVKHGTKPTQAVPPFTATKKKGLTNTKPTRAKRSAASSSTVAPASAETVLPERSVDTIGSLQYQSSPAAPALQEVPPTVLSQDLTSEVLQEETVQSCPATSSSSQSPVRTTLPQTSPFQQQLQSIPPSLIVKEQTPAAVEPTLQLLGSPPVVAEEPLYLLKDEIPSTFEALQAAANAIPQMVSYTNLNEEDDEEREGSQLVSVSDMSGTTQPTEESYPGSAGPVGGSAWRTGGALLSELDSEEVSGSQQGASELSAPGVLEGTESIDDLGDGSLKGAIDMEGASAGSPDFEKVPDIPVNDFDEEDDEDEDDDDDDRVCDMDVGSERADEAQKPTHDNYLDDEEDEDIEMASEGVTESGLESYGNADEDDFVEDERLDNLNRVAQPLPPLLPSAPACPLANPWQAVSEMPTQTPAQAWLEQGSGPFALMTQEAPHHSFVRDEPQNLEAQMYMDQPNTVAAPVPLSAPGVSRSSTLSSETTTPEELGEYYRDGKFQLQDVQMAVVSPQPVPDFQDVSIHMKTDDAEEKEEVVGSSVNVPTSNPSSLSSGTEDEPSNPEGKAQLDESLDSPIVSHVTFNSQPTAQCYLSTVEEGEEAEIEELNGAGEDTTLPSATSLASYAFETITTPSNSYVKSTGESCIKSPGIFSREKLPKDASEPGAIPQLHTVMSCLAEQQQDIECGKLEAESPEHVGQKAPELEETLGRLPTPRILQAPVESPDDIQPPYYSAFCKNTENSLAGFTQLPHPHHRDHAAYPRIYCDFVKPHYTAAHPLKLTCTDLPTRNLVQQILSPQLHRLAQHQKQLLELQQRREQQSWLLEGAEQERKRREEDEQRRKKEEAAEEIKRNKEVKRKMKEQAEVTKKEEEEQLRKQEELKERRDLELQLQQQQKELEQRQQIMQWQQELQQSNNDQNVLLSPSSGLCTIYEALENSDDEVEREEGEKETNLLESTQKTGNAKSSDKSENVTSDEVQKLSAPQFPDSPQTPSMPTQHGNSPLESTGQPSPLDLDWGKKVDIIQQLINQTLLLNRESCSSLLLLPGGAGGTLSPLESSLWPSLLPPLTPPSATVTSVSSFSPEATDSSPQGEWTVVELETHH